MLGLRSGTVRLDYVSDEATALFDVVRSRIQRDKTLSWQVEHIGSTAVADLAAKPILDIVVGVAGDEIELAITKLTELGYRYRGFRRESGGHIFDWREGELTTQHLHLVAAGADEWTNYLLVRDYLRGCQQARWAYEGVKKDLAQEFSSDRRAYTEGKSAIVQRLLEHAKR